MVEMIGGDFICLTLAESLPGMDNTDSTASKRCRLCVSRYENMVSIFSEEGKGLDLAFKINKLLPTMVTPMDKLPQEVCNECIMELNTAYEFVKKCMLSQTRLQKILNVYSKDYNVPLKVVEEYSAHWSIEDSNGHIRIAREHQKRRSKRPFIQSKEGNVGETEKNGHLKKINIMNKDKHQRKKTPIKDLENSVVSEMETKLPLSRVNMSNNDYSETNGHLKKINILRNNKHQHKKIPSKVSENGGVSEMETKLSLSSVDMSNNDCSQDSVSLSENISPEVQVISPCASENSSAETHDSRENKIITEGKHICKYCGKGFHWKADLFDHQTSVHSDLVFRCCFCWKVFYEKDALDSHELAHKKLLPPGWKVKKPLQCHSSKNKQEEVLILKPSDENEFQPSIKSEIDNKSIPVIPDENGSNKVCCYCNVAFTSLKLYRKHISSEHQFRLPCRFCPTTCPSVYELNRHETKHYRKPIKYLTCKKCAKKYESVDELREHELIHMHKDGLKCEICGEAFTNEVSLEEHIKIHGVESSYLCETCGQNFESFFLFRVHKLSHMYPNVQRCELCNSCFDSLADLENHLEVIHKKKKYPCKLCEETFTSSELLREHKAMQHKPEYKCESCGKTFTSAKKLRTHAQTHSSERNYLCEKCGKDFKLNSSLHKHRYLCQVAVSCNVCDRKFDSTTRLKIHMRIHTGEKPHVCSVCDKGFHATWALNQHMLTHNTVKIPCPICGTLFNRKANMLTHMMRHRVPCDTCGQVFANTPLLVAHQKIHVENGERPADSVQSKSYKCDECGKLFVTSLDLKTHLPSHSDECPHKCNDCGKSFRRSKALRKHMVMHGGHKPYQCRFCTCTFVVHQRLLKHENGHTAGKPYVCQVCGQGFWSPLNLEKHTLKHSAGTSGEQKYNCSYCDKSFAQKSSLIIHKRTHTAQLTYGCSFCPRKFSQLRFMQRHKCALNPNVEGSDSSLQKGLLSSLPSLAEEPSGGSDNIFPVSVLNEEIVYDMESSASYAEIIVISQNIDEFIAENNSELDK